MTKQNLENNVMYYHERFDKIIELFREGKESILDKEKDKINCLVEQYKKKFKANSNYNNTHISFIEAFILKK